MSKNFIELNTKELNATNGGGVVQALAEWIKDYINRKPLI